ncbi:MAG: hypothetical protein IKZ37_04230 [Bacteroidaceae bacterium]|nr:hypothetical protein [Bacteroidaceae bacterium]
MENIFIIFAIGIIGSLAAVIAFYDFYLIPGKTKQINASSDNRSNDIEKLENELSALQNENKRLNEEIDNNNILKYKKYAEIYDKLVNRIYTLDLQHSANKESTKNFDNLLKEFIFIKKDEKRSAYENYSVCIISGMEAYNISYKLGLKLKEVLLPIINKPLPLSDYDKKECLEKILDLSMICFDTVTTAFNNRNARERQHLNVHLLNGQDRSQLLDKAEPMTDRSDLTPLWIRIIKKSVESFGIKRSNTIFSGYKLS